MQYFLKKQNPLFTVEDRFSVTTQDRDRKNPLHRTKSELNSSLCAMNHFCARVSKLTKENLTMATAYSKI